MKKFISILLIAFSLIMVMPVIGYADYGNSISLYEAGNTDTLIYIKSQWVGIKSGNLHFEFLLYVNIFIFD